MIRRVLSATVLTLALATTPALGQQHQHGQQPAAQAGGMGGMQGGMMHMMEQHGVVPAVMLNAAEALALTDAQLEELRTIQARAKEEHDRHMAAKMAAEGRARHMMMMSATLDLEAYEAALREAAEHGVMGHVAMTRSSVEAAAVLTADQKRVLDAAVALMHSMAPAGGGMGGMNGMGGMGGGH